MEYTVVDPNHNRIVRIKARSAVGAARRYAESFDLRFLGACFGGRSAFTVGSGVSTRFAGRRYNDPYVYGLPIKVYPVNLLTRS